MRYLLVSILSLLTLNTMAVQSDVFCEHSEKAARQIQERSNLKFTYTCTEEDGINILNVIKKPKSNHIITDVSFGDLKPEAVEVGYEEVNFSKIVKVGLTEYIEVLADAINEHFGKEVILFFRVPRAERGSYNTYRNLYEYKGYAVTHDALLQE